MTLIHIVFAFTISCLLIPFANGQTVAPGQLFSGDLLNVRAPNSKGWKQVGSSGAGMAFARGGASSNESYVAQVYLFALPEWKDGDEFVALIKRGVENDTSPDRFKSLEANYEYTEQRGYPCVRFTGVTEDTKAKTSFFSRENLKLQVHSLYCRHPKRQTAAFVIAFSHRGVTLDTELELQAQIFIEGVQVPE